MSEGRWSKIVTDIFDDDKILLIESMPEADSIIVVWFKLLCLAGKQNNRGVFLFNDRIAYTDEMFSTIFRRPLNTVRMALKIFEEYGMIEIINGAVTIPQWEKHQQLDSLEMAKEATRRRVAEHRKRQKMLAEGRCNVTSNVTDDVTVTPCNADRIDIDKNNITIERYIVKNLIGVNPANMEEVEMFIEEMPEELIRYAVDESCASGVPNWRYTRAILRSLQSRGIKTVEQAKASKTQSDKQKELRVVDDANPALKAKFF